MIRVHATAHLRELPALSWAFTCSHEVRAWNWETLFFCVLSFTPATAHLRELPALSWAFTCSHRHEVRAWINTIMVLVYDVTYLLVLSNHERKVCF